MRSVIRLHVIACTLSVLTMAFVHISLANVVPSARMLTTDIVGASYNLWWASLILRQRFARCPAEQPSLLDRASTLGALLGCLVTVAVFWLTMPFATDKLRMLFLAFMQGPVALVAFASAGRTEGRGPPLAFYVIPIGIVGYFLVHADAFALPVIIYVLAFSTIFFGIHVGLKRALRDAQTARADAERERDAKAAFLAAASHDLGQPLQAARLYFDQAVRGVDVVKKERAVRQADAAFQLLERQLRATVDHLRLESGNLHAQLAPTPVGPVIAQAAALFAAAAEQAGVVLRLVPSTLAALGDVDLLGRVLANLLDNAIRHSGAKNVLLGVRRRGPTHLRFWVIDDGSGVAPEDVERIFGEFVRGSDHGDRERGGFGLGLASARRMAALMNGSVGLDRRRRRGSAFFLEVPAALKQTDAPLRHDR